MQSGVFTIILLSAALHAAWNAIVKGSGHQMVSTALVTASASLLALAALCVVTPPARASWPFILASVLVHVAYFLLLARTYRLADMVQTYPLMRGSAPLLLMIFGMSWLGERLSVTAWVGVFVLCVGIFGMMAGGGRAHAGAVGLALVNGVIIAGYTLIDGIGVRRSGGALAYTSWVFLLTGIPLLAWTVTTQPRLLIHGIRRYGWLGLFGGFSTIASYGLALWAMMLTPVAVIAALRETSILFGAIISACVLKERLSGARVASVATIALGAVILRLG